MGVDKQLRLISLRKSFTVLVSFTIERFISFHSNANLDEERASEADATFFSLIVFSVTSPTTQQVSLSLSS